LKRSQSYVKNVEAKMQEQQELHVQQCRHSAQDKWKMVRLAKLQRRVADYKSKKMQQCLKCVRAGDADPAFLENIAASLFVCEKRKALDQRPHSHLTVCACNSTALLPRGGSRRHSRPAPAP
jgi:hypothetical protein